MAQKRMFDKTITNSDDFLELPDSSQVLYFHLSMNADDDGFINNWRSIMKMTGTKEDDLKILIAKSFIIPFESGVIVIKHWRINNFLRKDRHIDTKFQQELSMLGLNDNQEYVWLTGGQPSKDKISKDKISKDKYNIYTYIEENFGRTLSPIEYEQISLWEDTELTRYAIKQAVLNGKYNLKYINAILNNWEKNKITTVQEAQTEVNRFKNPKNPEWFDKEIGQKLVNQEEEKEFLEKLKKARSE